MKRRFSSLLAVLTMLVALALVGCGQMGETPMTKGGQGAATTRVTFIDVGKGDCILVQAGGSVGLIDTGYEETSSKVVAYLRKQGVERLDFVVITHYDKDHVGGLRAVGESFAVDAVYLPGYEGADRQYLYVTKAVEDLQLPAQRVMKDATLELGDAHLTLFATSVTYVPDANGDEGNDNDVSLVTTLNAGDDSYLFAGDLEEEGIEAYLKARHGHFDVLKMPHHGEKASNNDDLLDSVAPSVVMVTDSDDEPADKKTLKVLKQSGADVYRTSEHGTIVVESDGRGTYNVATER